MSIILFKGSPALYRGPLRIRSMGCILAELMTGKAPFAADSDMEAASGIVRSTGSQGPFRGA